MSKCDRNEILERLLSSDAFTKIKNDEAFEFSGAGFEDDSGIDLIEALKKLAFDYCNEVPSITIIKNINKLLEKRV